MNVDSNKQPIIEICGLNVSAHGQMILEDIHLTVNKGDFSAIIGPNGAGKTTLIKAVLGLIPYDSGEIFLFNRPADSMGRKRIGYVPQYHAFDFQFPITVREMVLTGRLGMKKSIFSRNSTVDNQAVYTALSRIAADFLIDRPISDLSGGERQRVLIARALAGSPEILILDEPTVYVDTPTEEQFYQLLTSLAKEVTILMITHDIGVVSRHVTRVACLNRRLFLHESDKLSPEMISRSYGCPVDLITHGNIPHRVFAHHEE